jgi:prolyl-tRNA synthetase
MTASSNVPTALPTPLLQHWSKTLIPTARQVPAEAEVPSHQLMLRAGLIRKLGAGVYDYLPLGLRSLQKAMQIIREEMAAAGAVEVLLPALHPIELWQRTGRDVAYGDNLFVVKDRHGRKIALGPTAEEVITELVQGYVESYRDLPKTLYQIQTKFRDEFRPRFGVLRSREFQMKDAYSFHLRVDGPGGLDEIYQAQYDAYCRIFARCGLPYRIVEAESGPIGGSASHEFMVPSPTGEDTILGSDKGNYAANVEKCEIGKREYSSAFAGGTIPAAEPKGALEKIHTPGCPGIDDVCEFFKKNLGSKLKTQNMLKTLVCRAPGNGDPRWIVAVVRGDHDLNEAKLRGVTGIKDLGLADEKIAREAGFAIGFVGPHIAAAKNDVTLIVDADAARDTFWVTGANEVDHHVKGFHWHRDVLSPLGEPASAGVSAGSPRIQVADIRNAVEGDPSPHNDGGVLRATKGIEIGHVFKLGTKYSDAMGFTVLDEANNRRPVIMGCYGIGVNRILASAIEREGGNDENGILWPAAIAPFQVIITPIKYDGAAKDAVDKLAADLVARGIDVLVDDRDERPGVKFKDADLIGIPLRITLGDKTLAQAAAEVKPRTAKDAEVVKLDAVVERVVTLLRGQ